ncbi:MAG TPA: type IV toxin-antitoxin system AbiEi family antitoxin domain-containing protein [Acidimicrobiia bacterium]|nr:type IV toxin-antitoxin system AbiEi family antitoxin domain-containing protein [Acidimicrobiia bacterium]
MDVDVRIAAAAAAQHGLFTTADALAAGADSALITRRVQVGRWLRVARGLYSLPGMPDTWERSVSAAVLRLAPPSAASHRTAAHLHGLFGRPKRIEVVAVSTGKRNLPFIAHQCLDLVEAEIVAVDGIRVTDVPRTIIDIGVPAGLAVAQRVMDDALRKGLTTLEQLAGRIHRYGRRGRRGIGPARQLVVERLHWDKITDSVLEDAFLRLVDRSGLPRPTPQRRMVLRRGKRVVRVDFNFEGGLVVELDSEKFHTDRTSFQEDRRRQNALVQEGVTVLRFTWWDVMAAPDYVIATLSRALARAS